MRVREEQGPGRRGDGLACKRIPASALWASQEEAQEGKEAMSAVDDAFVSWQHHGADEALDKHSASVEDLIRAAFRAGWKSAGGDERLAGIELLQECVARCCGEHELKGTFCTSFGCSTLKRALRALGDDEFDGEGE